VTGATIDAKLVATGWAAHHTHPARPSYRTAHRRGYRIEAWKKRPGRRATIKNALSDSQSATAQTRGALTFHVSPGPKIDCFFRSACPRARRTRGRVVRATSLGPLPALREQIWGEIFKRQSRAPKNGCAGRCIAPRISPSKGAGGKTRGYKASTKAANFGQVH